MGSKSITPEEFDKKFDEGEDISEHLDIESATKRVNVDFNVNFLRQFDSMAKEIGVTRQSLIKLWLHERLQGELDKKIERSRIA